MKRYKEVGGLLGMKEVEDGKWVRYEEANTVVNEFQKGWAEAVAGEAKCNRD